MEKSTLYFTLIVLAILTPFLAKTIKQIRRKHTLRILANQLDRHPKIIAELGELDIKDTKSFYVDFKQGKAEITMVITGEKGSKFYNINGSRNGKTGWRISSIR